MKGLKFIGGSSDEVSLETSSSGTGNAVAMNDCRQIIYFAEKVGTVSSGTVIIEWAPYAGYAGDWALLDSIDMSASSTGNAGGTYPGALPVVRARVPVGTPIAGGGSVKLRINGDLN